MLRDVISGLVLSIVAIAATGIIYLSGVTESSSLARMRNGTLKDNDYWAEDHPYVYQPHLKRLPDGEVVRNNDLNSSSFAKYRDAVETKTPWISNWVLSTEGRRTLKKDVPRLLMYNLVSPMDYGRSTRSRNVRRRRNKAIGMFLTDNLALPLLKSLGHVVSNLIQSHYVGYFEDEIFAKRLEMMNASEMIQEFNLSLPMDEIIAMENEEARPNTTLAYACDGESRRAVLYARYSAAFAPYEGYSCQYYTRDDSLPPTTFPADSYPWLWSPRLNVTRVIALQLMESLGFDGEGVDAHSSSVGDVDAEADSCSSSCVVSETDKLQRELAGLIHGAPYIAINESAPIDVSISMNKTTHNDRTAMTSHEIQALEQVQVQLQEFYFETGIPRLANHSNVSHSDFPAVAEFLKTSLASGTGANFSTAADNLSEAGIFTASSLENISGNVTDFASRSGVYAGLTHFYAYPSVDKSFDEEHAAVANCSVEQPCLMQSGVTVYTPSLTTLAVFRAIANNTVDPATKRKMRLEALLEMARVAFEAERRALRHGLQGPSTVWYSNHDLDVDEFADAVLGTVNMSISGESGDPAPLHVFEKHTHGRVPILDEVVSYYADTNHATKISMELNRSFPMLDQFQESELVELISLLDNEMQHLDRSIVAYVETRAENPLYQEVVNTTTRGDLYSGSEYTLTGFGFVIPATNNKNVLYRDMRLPVPFHLALRLIIRFQESHLLLPQESRQLLICLAMAIYNLSFYRCRPATS